MKFDEINFEELKTVDPRLVPKLKRYFQVIKSNGLEEEHYFQRLIESIQNGYLIFSVVDLEESKGQLGFNWDGIAGMYSFAGTQETRKKLRITVRQILKKLLYIQIILMF